MPDRHSRATNFARAKLANGLSVLVAPDRSIPLVGVAVVYNVGFRSEPEGRTGFAHLFEHLMFQGSKNVAKVEHMSLVESAGGLMNGHTLPDLTAYYEALPASALELGLFLEADRMGGLALNEENLANQIEVVKEEIRVNVLNRPYGGFPWIPLPALAYDSYPNAHNGYGDFAHLEQASLEDAADFYARYYSPANAVLVIAGDCEPESALALAERYFADVPGRPAPFHGPWPEPPLPGERRKTMHDPLIPQPAFALGYRSVDPVGELERFVAYEVLAHLLSGGDASRLRSRLVFRDHSVTDVSCHLGEFGGDGLLMREPVLFQIVVHHPGERGADELIGAIDEELEQVADKGPDASELERVRSSAVAEHWRSLDSILDRGHTLASLETVHGRAELIEEYPTLLSAVPADAVRAAAADLLAQHRAVLELMPGGAR
ncbi:MAG: pitrilysin family protein [Actinomycetota bacterium]|nr:pitrilysin family protein [Actinomycetota bacterium]